MWVMWAMAAKGADCTPEAVAQVVKALALADASSAVPAAPLGPAGPMAARGFGEACPGSPAAPAAKQLAALPPEFHRTIDLALAADAPLAWIAACPGGLGPLVNAASMARADGRAAIYDACKLEATGGFDRSTFVQGDGLLVLPVLAWASMAASGVDPTHAKIVVGALIGPTSSPTAPGSQSPLEPPRPPRGEVAMSVVDEPPRPPSPRGEVAMSVVDVSGQLTDSGVALVLGRHQNQIQYCYTRALFAHAGTAPTGQIAWDLTVSADGVVTAVDLLSDTLGNAGTSMCIEGRFRRMQFAEKASVMRVQSVVRVQVVFRMP